MDDKTQGAVEQTKDAFDLASKTQEITGDSVKAKIYDRISKDLDVALIVENTINIVDKHGYEAGMA